MRQRSRPLKTSGFLQASENQGEVEETQTGAGLEQQQSETARQHELCTRQCCAARRQRAAAGAIESSGAARDGC